MAAFAGLEKLILWFINRPLLNFYLIKLRIGYFPHAVCVVLRFIRNLLVP